MKEKSSIWLPVLMMMAFAITRWPGLMPPNFSAAYAIAFCAGVYFAGGMKWWLPLGTLLLTDLALNLYYYFALGIEAFRVQHLFNYLAFGVLILIGSSFKPKHSWAHLLGGGILGAIAFYLITNTVSWFFNPFKAPEYTRDLAGWLLALTKGTAGYPQTWEFFRNTLLSGGVFTGLFCGAMKLSEAAQEQEDEESAEEPEGEPEEAK